jgi:hypothetical protein
MRRFFTALLMVAGLGAEPRQNIAETKTQTMAFPASGVLRLKHSTGDLNIEAWDNSTVEITTVKRGRTKAELDRLTITTEQHGDELAITTAFPKRGRLLSSHAFEYHISVPRAARLIIDHGVGAVNVDGVTGDIDAKLRQGEIMLHLPDDSPYGIDARAAYGNVNSDFPGEWRRRWFGQKAFADVPRPAHTLKLRVEYGDIVLLKTRIPKIPEAGAARPKRNGL